MIIFNNYATRFAQKVKDAETKKKEAASEASAGEETNESFLSILESIAPSTKEETRSLNELWRQLPGVEKDFLKTPNQANLNRYKTLVKDIIDQILQNNTEIVHARRRGRHDKKILVTVKIIDENLQLLALTMLSTQNSAFNLLKQIEKIRGLLLDLKE